MNRKSSSRSAEGEEEEGSVRLQKDQVSRRSFESYEERSAP